MRRITIREFVDLAFIAVTGSLIQSRQIARSEVRKKMDRGAVLGPAVELEEQ